MKSQRRLFASLLVVMMAVSCQGQAADSMVRCQNSGVAFPAERLDDQLTRDQFAEEELGEAILGLYALGGVFEGATEPLDETDRFVILDANRAAFLTDGRVTTVIEMSENDGEFAFAALDSCTPVIESRPGALATTFALVAPPETAASSFEIEVIHEKCDNQIVNPGIDHVEVSEDDHAIEVKVWVEPFEPSVGCNEVGNSLFWTVELAGAVGDRAILDAQVVPPRVVWDAAQGSG